MSGFNVEKMASSHLQRVAELEVECFSSPWSEAGLAAELENGFARFYVALCDGEIAGYIGAHNVLGEVYITNVAVFKAFRRQGVGSLLVEHLISQMKQENADFVTLEVRESNENAIALYSKAGFQRVGTRKDFYTKPREDAALMTYFYN